MFKGLAAIAIALILGTTAVVYAAPSAQNFQNIQPFTDNTYFNGTSALRWKNIFTVNASTTNLTVGSSLNLSSIVIPIANGGTNASSFTTSGNTVYYNGTSILTAPTTAKVTTPYASSTALTAGNLFATNLTLSNALPIASGGTNASSFTTTGNGVYYNGTSLLTAPLTSSVVYPYASTTAVTSTNASTTNLIVSGSGGSTGCAQFSAIGLISNTGSPCITSTGGGVATTSITATYPIVITKTTATINFADAIGTTTVNVCASGCPFSDPNTALEAGFKSIHLAPETFTLTKPLKIIIAGTKITGEGNSTVLNFDGTTIPTAMMLAVPTAAVSNMSFRDFGITETDGGFVGTCVDFSHMETSVFERVNCTNVKIGYIASSGLSSFYNKIDSPIITLDGGYGAATSSVGISLNDLAAIKTVIINPRIRPLSTMSSSTGIYIDSHDVLCLGCDVEADALYGIYVTSDGSNSNLNVYLEGNQTNLKLDSGSAGVNVTGTIETADTATQNIVDGGSTGLTVNAKINGSARNYVSGNNFGAGTSTPGTSLDVYDGNSIGIIRLLGAGSSEFQSAIDLDSNNSTKGSGVINYDTIAGTEWYSGTGFDGTSAGNDGFVVNRKTGLSSFSTGVVNFLTSQNFFHITSTGNTGVSSSSPTARLQIGLPTSNIVTRAFDISSSTPTATSSIFTVFSTGLASTSALIVSNAGGTPGCATFAADGTISNTGSVCGAGGSSTDFTFGTSNFSTTTAATTSSIWTKGVFFSTSTTQASQFPLASSTLFSVFNANSVASQQVAAFGSARPASQANGDNGYFSFFGNNNSGVPSEIARETFSIQNVVAGSEQGRLTWSITTSGVLAAEAVLTPTALFPASNDGNALGVSGTAWADLFLASGGVINWAAGDVTLTHSTNKLTLSAADNLTFDYGSTTSLTTGNLFVTGNLINTGTAPTVGGCGTAAISATSTDMRGTISVTAGTPTSCVVRFSSTKSDTPTCIADGPSSALGSVGITAASTTGVQLNMPAVFSGNIYYICLQ